MTTEIKRLIKVRVEKSATFKRDGFGKKRQLSDSWRKPRGQHNKQREQKKAKGALPKPGFGSPIAVRGMHPSGFFEVLVTSAKDLEGLDPKTQAVRIAASVGNRKRSALQEAVKAAGLKILNARTIKVVEKKPAKTEETEETEKPKKEQKAEKSKAKVEPAKKAAKEKKSVPEKKAKSETKAAKPKAEKPEGKKEAAKTKSSEKAPAKSVKAKAEKPAKAQDKPKAAEAKKAKPAAKKTKSGVKKND